MQVCELIWVLGTFSPSIYTKQTEVKLEAIKTQSNSQTLPLAERNERGIFLKHLGPLIFFNRTIMMIFLCIKKNNDIVV